MLCSAKEINATKNKLGKDMWERIRSPLGTKGLYLKVTPHNTKTVYYRYNLETGTKRYLICRWGEMPLTDIFVEHTNLAKEVRAGGDPMTERQRKRQQRMAKPDKPKTFNDVIGLWVENYAKDNLAGSTFVNVENRLNKWIKPQLGKFAVADLVPIHFKQMRDKAHRAGKTATANQIVQLCKGIISWAVDELLMATNPVRDTRKVGAIIC